MASATTDIPALLEGLTPGAWVAISENHDRVVFVGKDEDDNAAEVLVEAQRKGELRPLITRVPRKQSAMFFVVADARDSFLLRRVTSLPKPTLP
jgi:hypothetical protein